MSPFIKPFYEFGPFRLEVRERRLLRDGKPVRLTPRSFDILVILVQNSGHIVEKDYLMRTVWPDTIVEENSLNKNISLLRRALRESPSERYIETIPRQGYRFIASVRESGNVNSVAVLPFKVLDSDDSDNYLGMGMADALITKLSNIRSIIVRPTSSILKYKAAEQDLQVAGHELGVDCLLYGAIQRSGDRIRVTVQLVRAQDKAILWADKFDAELTNILAAEDSISEQVTQALRLRLSSEEKERLTKHYTENMEAYQLYLKGRYHWNKMLLADVMIAIEHFKQAIAKDPSFALAYTGLADSYCLLGFYSLLPPKESMPKARAAALRALQLDSTLAEAHTSLATVKLTYDWDWRAAEREFQYAIELNPNYATAHQWYSMCLLVMERSKEALERMRRAQEVDPLSSIINAFMGWLLHLVRRYDDALEQYRKTLDRDTDCMIAHFFLGLTYMQKSLYEEAVAAFNKLIELLGGLRLPIACIAFIYARLGKRDEAYKLLNELQEIATQGYVVSYHIALIYIGLGEKDKALEWLHKAYDEHPSWLIFLKVEPMLDTLRSEPRFLDLLRRVGFSH